MIHLMPDDDEPAVVLKEKVIARPSKRSATPKTSPERRAQMHAYYLANKEAILIRVKKWIAANPEKARESWRESERRRRAAKKAVKKRAKK